jgi:peptidylprolyl isomerase
MRALAAVLIASTTLVAQTTTTVKTPATTAKKATTATPQRLRPTSPTKPMPIDPKATEGLAAVGSMPAATGAPADLFTLRFIDLKVGDGEEARVSTPPSNVVFYTVNYTGWTTDGTKFDSSLDRNEPIVFPIGLKRVITGWDVGFEGMRVGGKRRLIIPWQLAYGAVGHPPVIPEKADLVFDIELVGQGNTPQPVTGSHFEAPPAPAAPVTPAAPAAKPAEKTEEHPE